MTDSRVDKVVTPISPQPGESITGKVVDIDGILDMALVRWTSNQRGAFSEWEAVGDLLFSEGR